MARITVEDCLEQVDNRFTLCLTATERTKQLMKGGRSLLDEEVKNKEIVTALREIAAGHVRPDMTGFDENENLKKQNADIAGKLPPSVDDLLPPAADDLPPEA
ncbi:MAG: DNA-directed RNA polymerase subunit omega [Myxococcales bacterium]|nr:DNA-directed RNA polymerase subunit omega [Myxococcales bacterium]